MVTVCGYPCAGKSTRAQQLATFLEAKLAHPSTPAHLKPRKVIIVNDESLSLSKRVYDGQSRRVANGNEGSEGGPADPRLSPLSPLYDLVWTA